jgi:uracil-DNA glycosylase
MIRVLPLLAAPFTLLTTSFSQWLEKTIQLPDSPGGLLDACGREVMALRAGANDVRHLPAGIYFVVTPHPDPLPQRAGERNRRPAIQRVVVTR